MLIKTCGSPVSGIQHPAAAKMEKVVVTDANLDQVDKNSLIINP